MRRKRVNRAVTEARALVAAGWVNGREHTEIGGRHYYCAIGAIREVTRHRPLLQQRVERVVQDAMHQESREAGLKVVFTEDVSIPAYNDILLGSQDAVVRAFDRAADRTRVVRADEVMTDEERAEMDVAVADAETEMRAERRLAPRLRAWLAEREDA